MKAALPIHHDVQVCADSDSMPSKNKPIGRTKKKQKKKTKKMKHREKNKKNACMSNGPANFDYS